MEGFTLEDLRKAVELSSMCMGVFDDQTGLVGSLNKALRDEVKLDEFRVTVTSQSDDRMYGRLVEGDVPVSLRVLSGSSPVCLVEVYLAHTKQCSTRSDVIELVEMTSDGVWEWFPTLQYEFMSERFWSILGYDHRVMPSSPEAWTGIIDPGDLLRAMACYDAHVATKGAAPYNLNVSYKHHGGHIVKVKCRGAVVEWLPDGTPWRLLGTHTDITEISEAVDAKARFVSRMSHEIRTPICAILHECELLEEHSGTAVIADSCDQLLSLCNDILTVEKLCRPRAISVARRSIRAEDFLQKAIRRHSGQALKKAVGLGGKAHRTPPGKVMVDVSKCNQVVDNLISNAIKYTDPPGGVWVELHCLPRASPLPPPSPDPCASPPVVAIAIEADEGGGSTKVQVAGEAGWDIEVVVKDTGLGIHLEDREMVFDKFRQANSSMQGAGLGLSISKELARLMSGDVILAHSEVGKGSTFVFSFPAPIAPPSTAPPLPTPVVTAEAIVRGVNGSSNGSTGVNGRPMIRILSADDMLTNRKIMRRRLLAIEEQLGTGGVDIVDAIDGRDAVRVFQDIDHFDIIFMDCLMPEMNGFDATREIHLICDARGGPRVPVVAVTASVSTALHRECREAGMSQVITKPFDAMDLMTVFAAAIDADGKDDTLGATPLLPPPPPPPPPIVVSASLDAAVRVADTIADGPPTFSPLPHCRRPHDLKLQHEARDNVIKTGPE